MRRLLFLLLFLAATVWAGSYTIALSGDASAAAASKKAPPTLAQQAATMSPGEWKKLDTANLFSSPGVAHTCAETAAITAKGGGLIPICGWGDSNRVLQAWNSAEYDPAGNRMFFWGGGHSSYGGNEVYEFDFDTLTWTRLTDAAPLSFHPDASRYLPEDVSPADNIPDTPGTPHTYDGMAWNETTGKLQVFMQLSVYPNGVLNSGTGACYEFDPSTLKWNVNVCHDYVQANCEYYAPDNETLCIDGQSTRLHTLYTISDDGKETNCGPLRGATQSGRWSHFIRDTDTGDLYDISYNVIAAITPDGCFTTSETDAVLPTADRLGFPVDFPFIGAASGHDGYLYMWQGDEKIIRYNTTTRRFDVIWNEAYKDTGPFTSEEAGLNKILGKWVYFPAEGVFAGIADGDPAHTRAGWWLWKPGPN